MNKSFILALMIIFTFGCSPKSKDEKLYPHQGDVSKVEAIVDNLSGVKFSNIYFSGALTKEQIEQLKEKGFSTIIDLRPPQEVGEEGLTPIQEKTAVEENEMAYFNVPFGKERPLKQTLIDATTAIVKEKRESGKILIHCSTGNRSASWMGAHFYRDHDYNKDQALAIAKDVGLYKEDATMRLKSFLGFTTEPQQGKDQDEALTQQNL